MARFRIVQKPSILDPRVARYQIQEKVMWWWEDRLMHFASFKEAENLIIKKLEAVDRPFVETRVIQEYQ
jgi:hypothetical protein